MNWIRTKDLQKKLALSETGLKRLMSQDPNFPKPVRVAERHVVYHEEAVEEWMRSKMLTSEQGV